MAERGRQGPPAGYVADLAKIAKPATIDARLAAISAARKGRVP